MNMNNQNAKEDHLISKIPYLSTSLKLFDEFLIYGYSEAEQKQIINKTKMNITYNIDKNNNKLFPKLNNDLNDIELLYNDQHPSLLSSISNPNKQSMLNSNMINYCLFPNSPPLIYSSDKKYILPEHLPEYSSLFVTNVDTTDNPTKTIFYNYAFIFYEEEEEFQPFCTYYFPKALCFISQYPFFSHYYDLAKTIRSLFSNLQVPIEFVLHNIINHSIAPVNTSINIEWVPDMFKGNLNIETKAQFDCLSGYPIVDIDLSEIFAILPIDKIIPIVVMSFLEIPMMVFSENIEILSCILYIVSILQYPFTDTMYLWHLVSVSEANFYNKRDIKALLKDSFLEYQSQFVDKIGSNLLGVNSTYNRQYDYNFGDLTNEDLFIIDIDNIDIIVHKNPNAQSKVMNFYVYLNDLFSNANLLPKNSLEENLQMLYQSLYKLAFEQITRFNDNINNNPKKNKGMKFKFIKTITKDISIKNTQIQEIFYSFILNIMKPFNSFATVTKDINHYCEEQKNLLEYINKSSRLNKDISLNEFEFYEQACESSKIILFCHNFISKAKALDCYLIPLIFFEEFLHMNNSVQDEYAISHIGIIDSFYKSNNFNDDNKDQVLEVQLCNYNLIIKNFKPNSYLIQYISTHLNQRFTPKTELKTSLIYLYNNILSDMNIDEEGKGNANNDNEREKQLYPVYDIKYSHIKYNDINEHLEGIFLKTKRLSINYIIAYATMMISIITLEVMNKEDMSHMIELVIELLINAVTWKDSTFDTQFLRNSITIYMKVLYHYIHKPNKLKVPNQFLFTLYHQLLDVLILLEIQPNRDLLNSLKAIDAFDNSSIKNEQFALNEYLLMKMQEKINPSTTSANQTSIDFNMSSLNISMSNDSNGLIKEKSRKVMELSKFPFIVRLMQNKCKNGVTKAEILFRKIKGTDVVDKNITYCCPSCHIVLKPKIVFKTIKIELQEKDKKDLLKADIYSPLKIYNISKELMKTWKENHKSYNALNRETIKHLVVNLMFYQSRLPFANTIPVIEELFIENKEQN